MREADLKFKRWIHTAALAVAALALSACAGSKQSPEDEAREGLADVRASIQTVVSDPDRAAKAIALVDQMERDFEDIAEAIESRQAAFRKLSADYNAPRSELEDLLAQVRKSMRDNRKRVANTHRQLVATLTADEWDKLDKQTSKALSKAVAAARS